MPSFSNAISELHKERSFCNPEDTEEAAAIGRQVSSCLALKFKCVFLKQRRLILSMPSHFLVELFTMKWVFLLPQQHTSIQHACPMGGILAVQWLLAWLSCFLYLERVLDSAAAVLIVVAVCSCVIHTPLVESLAVAAEQHTASVSCSCIAVFTFNHSATVIYGSANKQTSRVESTKTHVAAWCLMSVCAPCRSGT